MVDDLHRRLAEALRVIAERAKRNRKSSAMVGPVEYQDEPRLMRVWQRTLYHEGRETWHLCRDALAAYGAVVKAESAEAERAADALRKEGAA